MKERRSKIRVCIYLLTIFLTVSITFLPLRSFAGDMEIMLDEMVKQGVITREQGDKMLKGMQERKAKEQEKAGAEKPKVEGKATEPDWVKNIPDWIKNPPDWVKNIKFSGDLRLRYQWEHRDTTTVDDPDRNRFRFRWRVGAETKVFDNLNVGFGLASGGGDPRSTNQTFQDTFSKKPLTIDYAFAAYKPFDWVTLSAGKLKQTSLWYPSDLLWDTDITPEGVGIVFNQPILPMLDVFVNTSVFILDENATNTDPWMLAIQPGVNFKIEKIANLKVALAYYKLWGIKNKPKLDYSSNTNTLSGGRYVNSYNVWAPGAEISVNLPVKMVPYASLYGEYVYNPDPSTDRQGYIAGIKFGHKDIKKFADWQAGYSYRRLERDAWPDVFPDSDFYGGATNVKGHELFINFGLWKHLTLGLDYYHTMRIKGARAQEDLLQADIVFKF